MDFTTIGNVTLRDVFTGLTQLLSGPATTLQAPQEIQKVERNVPDWIQANAEEIPAFSASEVFDDSDHSDVWDKTYRFGIPALEMLPVLDGKQDYWNYKALNWSTLKRFLDDPRWFSSHSDQPLEESDAMKLGTMVHCAVLEPHDFNNRYAKFIPPVNEKTGEPYKSGKAYDAAREEFEKAGKIACTDDQLCVCQEIINSLTDSGLLKYFRPPTIDPCKSLRCEIPLCDPDNNIKGKIDCYHEEYGLIDFKTCSQPIADTFGNDLFQFKAKKMGYIYQLAFYAKIIRDWTDCLVPCSIIATETSAPYRCGFYEISEATIMNAIKQIENEFYPRWKDYVSGEKIINSYRTVL